MSNVEHLSILKEGVERWNEWRNQNPGMRPDLSNGDLSITGFRGINFSRTDLSGADLFRSDLADATLTYANLNDANLNYVSLVNATLAKASLVQTDLTHANLSYANLRRAILRNADFTCAHLRHTNFSNALLYQAKFVGAKIGSTMFVNNDLSETRGLDSVEHNGPSIIAIDTIYRSKGRIPEIFLRRAGVPENFITYMMSLTRKSFEFYSCFISYSSNDQEFAERIYLDLQSQGVRCWFAPEDLKIGDKIRDTIDESIRIHDKLLLVLSQTSVSSQWVEQEVETALAREREQGRVVLFPIRVDEAVMNRNEGWPAFIKRTRQIGDFSKWKDHDAYQKSFKRLTRDLMAEEHAEDRA
jgi:uncharacterized protein YjbI with pentapeptide repeats